MTTDRPADTTVDAPADAALSTADRIRLERYLARFAWAMQDYPGREYRRIKRELRAEITAAAADVGMAAALRDLGHPTALAEGYTATLAGRRPRFVAGAVAAGMTVGAIAFLALAYSFGVIDGLAAAGGGSASIHPLGVATTITSTPNEISIEWTVTWQWLALYLGAGALAFILGSRLWRLLRHRD